MQKSRIERLMAIKSCIDSLAENIKIELDCMIASELPAAMQDKKDNDEFVKLKCIIETLKEDDMCKGYEKCLRKCFVCRGDGRHNDWCPWLSHQPKSTPNEALISKFTCGNCKGVMRPGNLVQ